MFEKFSISARRVAFHAWGQASVFGARKITPELLLMGMLQENALELGLLIGGDADTCDELRKKIEENIPRAKPVPTSLDMPVSKELGRVFQHAIEKNPGTGVETVQLGHLRIGILREKGCYAAELLRGNGSSRPAGGPVMNSPTRPRLDLRAPFIAASSR